MTDRGHKLRRYLAERRARAFGPGDDCAVFIADWWKIVTGHDPAARWRGQYASLLEGRAALRRDGFAQPSGVLAPWHLRGAGWMRAKTGDVVTILEDGWEAFGIVGGGHIHVLRAPRGLDAVPLPRAIGVFRP